MRRQRIDAIARSGLAAKEGRADRRGGRIALRREQSAIEGYGRYRSRPHLLRECRPSRSTPPRQPNGGEPAFHLSPAGDRWGLARPTGTSLGLDAHQAGGPRRRWPGRAQAHTRGSGGGGAHRRSARWVRDDLAARSRRRGAGPNDGRAGPDGPRGQGAARLCRRSRSPCAARPLRAEGASGRGCPVLDPGGPDQRFAVVTGEMMPFSATQARPSWPSRFT